MVDQIEDGHCRLTFGEGITVELHGQGADELISRLLGECELIDRTLMADHIEKFRSRKPGKKIQSITGEDETDPHE
jgi:hypothetical protein